MKVANFTLFDTHKKCDEQCFQYKAVFDWNSLPLLLTSQTNFSQLICTLNKYITSKLT